MFRRLQQSVVVCLCVMMLIAPFGSPVAAGMKEAKKQPSSAVGTGKRLSEKPITKHGAFPGGTASRLSAGDKKADVIQRPKHATGASSSRRSKTLRRADVNKVSKATFVPQPSQRELMFYGLLETPQRYDPRLNRRTSGMPVPQMPDITRDHFLELDRNRDGHVDPVERAFGRLDMEHDFQPR